jgi:Mago nashi protein.
MPVMITLFYSVTNLHAEFDLRTISEGSSAAVRYANNSNYRNDSLIRKESEQEHTYQKREANIN